MRNQAGAIQFARGSEVPLQPSPGYLVIDIHSVGRSSLAVPHLFFNPLVPDFISPIAHLRLERKCAITEMGNDRTVRLSVTQQYLACYHYSREMRPIISVPPFREPALRLGIGLENRFPDNKRSQSK